MIALFAANKCFLCARTPPAAGSHRSVPAPAGLLPGERSCTQHGLGVPVARRAQEERAEQDRARGTNSRVSGQERGASEAVGAREQGWDGRSRGIRGRENASRGPWAGGESGLPEPWEKKGAERGLTAFCFLSEHSKPRLRLIPGAPAQSHYFPQTSDEQQQIVSLNRLSTYFK